MKRYSYLLIVLWIGMGFTACVDDPGNYDYDNIENQFPGEVVSGLEESYVREGGKLLEINPVFAAGTDESDYEYLWFTISRANLNKSDTLSREKNLSYAMALPTGEYILHFEVMNKPAGTSVFYKMDLRTTTSFSHGWFITKVNREGETDIDMITFGDETYLRDLLTMVNGSGVPGKPRKTAFMHRGFLHMVPDEEGIPREQPSPAFLVGTDSELYAYGGDDMLLSRTTDKLFYERPEVMDITEIAYHDLGNTVMATLVNDGGCHGLLAGMSISAKNQFTERMFFSLTDKVNIAPYLCKVQNPVNMFGPGVLVFFDLQNNSFRRINTNMFNNSLSLAPLYKDPGDNGVPDCNNMPYELVYMKEYNYGYYFMPNFLGNLDGGLAILRSKTDASKYYGARLSNLTNAGVMAAGADPQKNPITAFVPVPSGAVVSTATVRSTNQTNGTIYCSAGDNRVYAYRVGSPGDAEGKEELVLTLEAGEKVAYLQDLISPKGKAITTRHLLVLANKGENWKLYCYNYTSSSSDIPEQTPVKTYTGEGEAFQVIYRGVDQESVF